MMGKVALGTASMKDTRYIIYLEQMLMLHYDETRDRLCGLVFLATDPEVLGSIPGASRFSEKQWVWNRVYSAS
jgi:hypothetical protein